MFLTKYQKYILNESVLIVLIEKISKVSSTPIESVGGGTERNQYLDLKY